MYLSAVQFFFQFGFALRIVLFLGLDRRIRNSQSGEPPVDWKADYQFWYGVLPVFYEALPILVVYLHHIKNFREKQPTSVPTESSSGLRTNSSELRTESEANSEQKQQTLLKRAHSSKHRVRRVDNRLQIGTDLFEVHSSAEQASQLMQSQHSIQSSDEADQLLRLPRNSRPISDAKV